MAISRICRWRVWCGIALLPLMGAMSLAGEDDAAQLRSGIGAVLSTDELMRSGEVYFAGVRAPLGAFVLAKRGRARCAIVIEKIWEEGEDQAPSMWSGGGRKQFATYTSYYRRDGKSELTAPNYRSVSATLSRLAPVGPGRLALARGNRQPNCGGLQLHWSYPNWIEFYGTRGLELAITQITEPQHVQFDSPELRWISEDPNGVRAPAIFERTSLCCSHESTN